MYVYLLKIPTGLPLALLPWKIATATLFGLTGVAIASFLPVPAQAQIFEQQFNVSPGGSSVADRRDADQLVSTGIQQQEAGDLEGAIASWQQALDRYIRIGDFQATGFVYARLGMAFSSLGRFVEAEDVFRRRLAIARDSQDVQGQIYGLNNVGALFLRQANAPAAIELFQEALAIAQRVDDPAGQSLTLGNLGFVAAQQRDYDTAIRYYEAAIAFRGRPDNTAIELRNLNQLGNVYQLTNRPTDALRVYLAAYQLAKIRGDRTNRLQAIDNLVALYQTTGQLPQAFELLQERQILSQNDDLQQQIISARSLAEYYVQIGDRAAAQNFFQHAIGLARQLQDRQQEAQLVNRLANLAPTVNP